MSMDRKREADSPLRRVEFHILLSLAAGERHGYGIIQDIQAAQLLPHHESRAARRS
jgi:hypothetical protein